MDDDLRSRTNGHLRFVSAQAASPDRREARPLRNDEPLANAGHRGCRVVLPSNDAIDQAVGSIQRHSLRWYEVARITDYRQVGRPDTGYRAVHVLIRRDGCLLEIQLRTDRQHGWAEAVERAATRTGHRLKDGEGPQDLVGYFNFTSELLADLDRGKRLTQSKRAEFKTHDRSVQHYFPDMPPGGSSKIRLRDARHQSSRDNNWLLVYDWKNSKQYRWMDCGPDCIEAARMYAKWERDFPWRDGYEVVLIGSDSRETIEWTHAHYFGRSADDLDPHGVLEELRTA